MFLQAAGYPDVVDPQEAAAGEGDIPGGVQGEHGLRAPLKAGGGGGGVGGGEVRRSSRDWEGKPRGSSHITPPLGGRDRRRELGDAAAEGDGR